MRPSAASYLFVLALLCAGCASPWREMHRGQGWSLYVQDAREVEIARYESAFEVARSTVESHFGPFRRHLRVHAWTGGARMDDGTRGRIEPGPPVVEEVPGIGSARVRGFHARGSDLLGDRSGVFLGQADTGTAVHELVHARLAERGAVMPLWLEEGIAMVLGDGTQCGGAWCVDGLACWPLRELAEESLNDAQLELLLGLMPGDPHDLRTNVLVHFLGWSVVFDLYREEGRLDWQGWLARYANGISVAEARARMERSLSPETVATWLERLDDPDPAVRLACCRGLWKLRSRAVADRLVQALEDEEDPDVAASLAVNLLATAGDTRIGRRTSWRMRRLVGPVLREPRVEDEIERRALRTLYDYYRSRVGSDLSKQALRDLARYLEE